MAIAIFVIALAGCDFPGGGSSSGDSNRGTSTAEPLELGSPRVNSVSGWATRQGFAANAKAVAGAKVFAQVGCLNCHTYLDTGSSVLGAPDLSTIGRQFPHRSAEHYADYIADPSSFGDEVMPHFDDLGRPHLLELGAFLVASKGAR